MKVNRLETHDRLLHFKQQQDTIAQGVQDCIRHVSDEYNGPFYVYGHARTVGLDEKLGLLMIGQSPVEGRLIWMPVVTKPKAEPNTYLFLCHKGTDVIEIIWMLPKIELWQQYAPGNMCHNPDIWTSIQNYTKYKDELEKPDPNGPSENDIRAFRKIHGQEAHERQRVKRTLEKLS